MEQSWTTNNNDYGWIIGCTYLFLSQKLDQCMVVLTNDFSLADCLPKCGGPKYGDPN